MKEITKEWLMAAGDDLKAAKTLLSESSLTNLAAFHSQQCIEKCFKAIAEEKNLPVPKPHDLISLYKTVRNLIGEIDSYLLYAVNELYIDSRYPGEFGLLPDGKPTTDEALKFTEFAALILNRVNHLVLLNE